MRIKVRPDPAQQLDLERRFVRAQVWMWNRGIERLDREPPHEALARHLRNVQALRESINTGEGDGDEGQEQ
jgi:hypothetical protein